jgi:hypothetical protein
MPFVNEHLFVRFRDERAGNVFRRGNERIFFGKQGGQS